MVRTTDSLCSLSKSLRSQPPPFQTYLIDELIIHRSIIHDIRIPKAPNTRDFEIRSRNLLYSGLYVSILVQVAKPPRVSAGKVLDFAVDGEVPADSLWCLRGGPGEAPWHSFSQADQGGGRAEDGGEGSPHGG